MKILMLPVLICITVHFAFPQMSPNAETTWVVASPQSGNVQSCVQHFAIGNNMMPAPGSCIEKLYTAAAINSAMTSITNKTDGLTNATNAINARLDDLGLKVNSLNKRTADDEAALPGQIDQLAVEKLLEKISALEARVKELENKLNASKP